MAHDSILLGSGDQLVDLRLKRVSKGLLVVVKAHPMLEEIFQTWSIDGATEEVSQHGRYWRPADPEEASLNAYVLGQPVPSASLGSNCTYNVQRLGVPLIEGGDPTGRPALDEFGRPQIALGPQTVNIGFLRLVGISQGEGKSFIVRGMFSTEGVQEISKKVLDAIRRLFMDYMRPVEISVVISSK